MTWGKDKNKVYLVRVKRVEVSVCLHEVSVKMVGEQEHIKAE